MDKKALDLLQRLVATPTPTGFEEDGMRLLGRYLIDAGLPKPEIDVHGNLRACLNPKAPFRVMIEGHCDEVGFLVQYVDEDGFLYMSCLGGIAVPQVLNERIVIQGKRGPVNGVFAGRPVHLMTGKEREECAPTALSKIFVDIGAKNREDALKMVELGAPAVVNAGWRPLGNDRVSCRGFDNRVGAFVIMETMKRLAKRKLNAAVYGVASVAEEIGLVGGTTTAYDINPDIGFCCDVTFATDAQKEDCKQAGDIRLGRGPAIGVGPVYNRRLGDFVKGVAEKAKIPSQIEVCARGDGTCAWAMRMTRSGAAVSQVSVPLRYMHTPIEVISLDDVENTIELLAETVASIPAGMSLKPAAF